MDRERLVSDEGPREESEPELFEEEDTEVVSEHLSEFGDESALDEPALDEGAIDWGFDALASDLETDRADSRSATAVVDAPESAPLPSESAVESGSSEGGAPPVAAADADAPRERRRVLPALLVPVV